MGRKRINEAAWVVRVRATLPKRLDHVLKEGEKQADFLRNTIESEISRREAQEAPKKRRRQ